MARRPTVKSELDRLVVAVAELQQELARLRASRQYSSLPLVQPPGTPAVPAKVKITAMRNVTHDKTTRAMRPVECVTRKLAARNSRPNAIISG